jgi:hypothetical protein
VCWPISKAVDEIADAARGTLNFESLSEIRHLLGVRKAPLVVNFIADLIEGGAGKVVVMCHHRDVEDLIFDGLEKIESIGHGGVSIHRGGMNDKEKDSAEQAFRKNPNVKVFVGSIQASGVGITLVESHTMVFAELDWVPGNMKQAEDRIHRIGQDRGTNYYLPVVAGTVDARMAHILVTKLGMQRRLLDEKTAVEYGERDGGTKMPEAIKLPELNVAIGATRPAKNDLERWAVGYLAKVVRGEEKPRRPLRWHDEKLSSGSLIASGIFVPPSRSPYSTAVFSSRSLRCIPSFVTRI